LVGQDTAVREETGEGCGGERGKAAAELLGRWPSNGSKSPPWSICRASVRVKEDGRKRKEKGGEISSMCWAGPTHVVCGSRPARACVTSRKMNPPSEGQQSACWSAMRERKLPASVRVLVLALCTHGVSPIKNANGC
jgi:hypothetical protein